MIAAALNDGRARRGAVVACSALRFAYRERLRIGAGAHLQFVYLEAEPTLMRERVGTRHGHYMPASLVDSQFAALELPHAEPDVVIMPCDADLDAAIPSLVARLSGAPHCS